jgi:SAM-dependent methyltransferase
VLPSADVGESNAAHFGWLSEAILRHRALLEGISGATLFAIGEQLPTPPIRTLTQLLAGSTTVRCFDLHPRSPDVTRLDINDLSSLQDRSCDIITLIRTSVFIRKPDSVFDGFHRILRPGGFVFVDWLHGGSDAPVIDLGPYVATYLDDELLKLPAFGELLRHVAHPPRWSHLARVTLRRLRHPSLPPIPLLPPGQQIPRQNYPDVLRRTLENAGKTLITDQDIGRCFTVKAREARYFYPETRTFACWALTIIRPV